MRLRLRSFTFSGRSRRLSTNPLRNLSHEHLLALRYRRSSRSVASVYDNCPILRAGLSDSPPIRQQRLDHGVTEGVVKPGTCALPSIVQSSTERPPEQSDQIERASRRLRPHDQIIPAAARLVPSSSRAPPLDQGLSAWIRAARLQAPARVTDHGVHGPVHLYIAHGSAGLAALIIDKARTGNVEDGGHLFCSVTSDSRLIKPPLECPTR